MASCQIGGNFPGPDDDVCNITVCNIKARCSGGHGIVRLLVQDGGIKMHHVTVHDVASAGRVAVCTVKEKGWGREKGGVSG